MNGHPNTRETILALAYPEPNSGCWLWEGRLDRNGYGHVKYQNRSWLAHRIVYTLLRTDVPAELHLDHLCRNTSCVNPDHLEPVTALVNTRRGLRFKNRNGQCHRCGHDMHEYTRRSGVRVAVCVPCRKERFADYKTRNLEKLRAANRESVRRYAARKKAS